MGKKVLVIDLDPQGNASTGLGIPLEDRISNSYDLLLGERPAVETIQKTEFTNLFIVPSTVDLSSADIEMVSNEKRVFLLHDALKDLLVSEFNFEYVLIDCPPSLNLLTINALVAAQSVLVPLQSEFFALEGLSQLMLTVREVRQTANKDLRIEGVVLTMYDQRNNLSIQVEKDARENLGQLVFKTLIPRNVRLSEAPSFAMPINAYDPTSKGSIAYKKLALEILDKHERGN